MYTAFVPHSILVQCLYADGPEEKTGLLLSLGTPSMCQGCVFSALKVC